MGLAAAGCSADPTPTETTSTATTPSVTSPASPSAEPAPASPTSTSAAAEGTPALNSRGNLAKVIGQEAGVGDPDGGPPFITFTVTDITTSPDCDAEFGEPQVASNGTFVTVMVEATTGPALDPATFGGFFNPNAWQVVDEGGVTRSNLATAETYACTPNDERLPDTLAPSSKYEGEIVLDSPSTTGSLIFASTVSGSWEWPLP